ncbi:MAG TPA: hypothetical protein VF733_00865 [Candidatus Saccharimonadales bacterium]
MEALKNMTFTDYGNINKTLIGGGEGGPGFPPPDPEKEEESDKAAAFSDPIQDVGGINGNEGFHDTREGGTQEDGMVEEEKRRSALCAGRLAILPHMDQYVDGGDGNRILGQEQVAA